MFMYLTLSIIEFSVFNHAYLIILYSTNILQDKQNKTLKYYVFVKNQIYCKIIKFGLVKMLKSRRLSTFT